jgi:hypothetical protein
MRVTIDIQAIAQRAQEYQEDDEDYSYPFWMAFRDLYPEEGNLIAILLKDLFKQNFPKGVAE